MFKRPATKRPAMRKPAKRSKVEETKTAADDEILFGSDEESMENNLGSDDEGLLLASDAEEELGGEGKEQRKLPFLSCPNVADFVRVFLREPVFSNIRHAIAENLRNVDTLRVGSMCSGWGVLEMVLGTLQREWNEQELGHSHFKAEMSFMVEIDNKKQNYLRSRFPEVPCVFNDMSEMGKSKAATWDGSSQSVPKVDILVAGFPCVSISPLTTTPGSVMDGSCQSGLGFKSVESYCKKHLPPMVLLENVGSLFHQRTVEGEAISAYDRMVKALRKLGYRVVGLPCNTADYGLPQQRCRAWVMCILESECDSDAEELMVKALKAFKCQPLPLEVLISDNQTSQASQPKPRGKKDEVPKWKTALTWECQRLGKEKLEARIKEIGSKAVCCSEREVAILSAAIEELVQNKNVNPLKELMVIQVDQSFGRQTYPKSNLRTTSCIIPGGKYICTGAANFRAMSDKERASLQGIGPDDWHRFEMDKVPSSLMRSFVGNSFSAPVNLAAFVALLSQWRPRGMATV